MADQTSFPALLEAFFTRRLIAQRRASPHTVASYRDTFRLLFQFAEKQLAKVPSRLTLEDLNAPFLGAFLDHLESTRANGARSRNLRLTARWCACVQFGARVLDVGSTPPVPDPI
jgi:site-specific recombinase XerC